MKHHTFLLPVFLLLFYFKFGFESGRRPDTRAYDYIRSWTFHFVIFDSLTRFIEHVTSKSLTINT